MNNLYKDMYSQDVVCLPGENGYPAGIIGWSNYTIEDTTIEQLDSLWDKFSNREQIIYLGGYLQVFDFDLKNDRFKNSYEVFVHACNQSEIGKKIIGRMVIVKTKSAGYHWLFKVRNPRPSVVLAAELLEKEGKPTKYPFIETRGAGGCCMSYPSPRYELIQGDIQSLPLLTEEEVDWMFDQAESQDRMPLVIAKPKNGSGESYEGEETLDDMISLLEKHNWTVASSSRGRTYLRRPGANTKNIDANIRVVDGRPIFWAHSTSTMFEEKGYDYFGVYGMLECNGDFVAAMKKLNGVEDNSGPLTPLASSLEEPPPQPKKKEEPVVEQDELGKELEKNRFIYGVPVYAPEPIFKFKVDGRIYPVGAANDLGGIIGRQKSRKTTVTSAVAACAMQSSMNAGEWIGPISFCPPDGTNMLWFDTEHGKDRFYAVNYKVYGQAGMRTEHPRYHSYNVKKYSVEERFALIEYAVMKHMPLGLVVIDGLVDLCLDFNSTFHSTETMNRLLKIQGKCGACFIVILHTNKTDRNARGHLGGILTQKADWVVEVSKSEKLDDVSSVACKDMRYREFPAFDIQVDDNNMIRTDNISSIFNPGEEIIPGLAWDDEAPPF